MGPIERRGMARRTVVVAFPIGADASVQGPVGRLFDAGVDAYFVAHSLRELGGFLRRTLDETAQTETSTEAIEVRETTAALATADASSVIPEADDRPERREVVEQVQWRERPDP